MKAAWRLILRLGTLLGIVVLPLCCAAAAVRVSYNEHHVFLVDGKAVFPFFFMSAPPPDGKTPWHTDGYAELKRWGAVFHHCVVRPGEWARAGEATLQRFLDRSAETGLLCAAAIRDLDSPAPGDTASEDELRRAVRKFKDHPGLGIWKGFDEPEWGKVPVARCQNFHDIVRAIDPDHPVWIIEAPRGTIESLKRYEPACEISGVDIYPIGYPPGRHSDLPNKEISVVGDYARRMREVTGDRKPFVMCLQICWSGVAMPGKTLRMPTFPEQRYMSYQAIINGARALLYFGGNVPGCQNERDRALGWNWTYYDKILKPVLEELGPAGPLYPALIAPDSKLPIQVEGANDVEFRVREANGTVFLLAARREGATVEVKFSGLPPQIRDGDVLYEEPRRVVVRDGSFTDWFGPNEVHVYRFRRISKGS